MFKNIAILALPVILFAGCRSAEDSPAATADQPEKITLTINVQQAPAPEKPAVKRPVAPEKPHRKAQVKKTSAPAASRQRSVKEEIPRGSIDGDLNNVEQKYLRDVRRRQQQQKRENERRVFGGFSPGELFR